MNPALGSANVTLIKNFRIKLLWFATSLGMGKDLERFFTPLSMTK